MSFFAYHFAVTMIVAFFFGRQCAMYIEERWLYHYDDDDDDDDDQT